MLIRSLSYFVFGFGFSLPREGISCIGYMHPPSHGMWVSHVVRGRIQISDA